MTLPILVIDHGAGNLVSITRALAAAGAEPRIIENADQVTEAAGLVLPGVGATGPAMDRLTGHGLVSIIKEWRGPLLGICVGFQLMFDQSIEDDTPCLGLLGGTVERLTAPRLPHMGWNDLVVHAPEPLLDGTGPSTTFYFVHSYAPIPDDGSMVVATTDYHQSVVAMVRSGNRVGVQFHPERSGDAGRRLMTNFVESCRQEATVAS